MKRSETRGPKRRAMPTTALHAAILGAVVLSGCSSGHIGESWQCPLATGGSCGSVAAVDPAVPDAGHGPVLDAPLWRKREDARDLPEATVCAGDCGAGSGPFGWLGRLFPDRHGQNDGRAREKENEPGNDAPDADSAISSAAFSALPAEPDSVPKSAGADDLRSDEVVARIWIAPFVDGDGVYREASHVRVVLEPASWRTE